jgi:AraC-like DNA-binding protein
MKLTFIQPRLELRAHVESFWVFESEIGLPPMDQSLAAPNGCPKLIIPYENSLESIANNRSQVSQEQGLYFVGNMDTSTMIRSTSRRTGFIAIEFSPCGAFPFFGIPMHETFNGLFDSESVFGKWGREIRNALCDQPTLNQKVECIQSELVRLLTGNSRSNDLVAFCVRNLKLTHGRLPIQELERKTGFTRQHIDAQFRRHVGLSPKTLAGILRFQKFYRKWAQGMSFDVLKDELYDDYYDQAHFAKEFKRMTGYSPRQYSREVSNEFGRRLSLK